MRSAFPRIVAFRPPTAPGEINLNTFLVAMATPREPVGVPLGQTCRRTCGKCLIATLQAAAPRRRMDPALVVTDEHNIFSILNAPDQLAFRRLLVQELPPEMLVN